MHRFFVTKKINNTFILDEKVLNHIKVLRIKNDFFICNYNNEFYKCKLENKIAIIVEKLNIDNEFKNEVVLAMALINPKNFELVLQKATELGATKIIPFISKFSNFKKDFALKKIERWNEIILNASSQSFRNKVPILEKPLDFSQVLDLNYEYKYIAYENTDLSKELNTNLFCSNSIFIIGPEGGFFQDEIKTAIEKGWKTISLGKRILRSETAAFFVLSRVNE
ncbi:16S rRNA (uracil(1498)-N(3))-methyltransferase [[Mycoplasma] mobile]|uniref:Ribosomal RNA small subunit methyltransferase E n=1 Tax=Mycoplasma mobile (strain ATCC 43663 / 163K / NCTC 11711) TaxID=267748 RepID=Q6KI62_MYCM1|nr:16S rRNA (uracil(1498)-N(3))-methyltransferase [[Mycoplasma] mobile]AAT27714.1 expressed protein [Mycoplasma mobile 163K]